MVKMANLVLYIFYHNKKKLKENFNAATKQINQENQGLSIIRFFFN